MVRTPSAFRLLFAFSFPFFLLPAGCSESGTGLERELSFLEGTGSDPQIGLVAGGNALWLFQLGDPEEDRSVALGAGQSVTPTGLSTEGRWVVVPLGNAASVALVDPEALEVQRFFLFEEGNATGSTFVDGETFLAANPSLDLVGRVRVDQDSDRITQTVEVARYPTHIVMAGGRAVVISSNLDENFAPDGPGVATVLDPSTLEILAEVETGGENPTSAAVGPDGRVYVVNTGNFVDDGSVGIIDPQSGTLEEVVPGFGPGPGAIHVDPSGRVFVSGFFTGTVVWDAGSRSFIRPVADPVCAPLAGGGCRGAFTARTDAGGRLYQVFFGSTSEGLPPQIFVYEGSGYTLADSIPSGIQGPVDLAIRVF